ncbi:MAG: glycosyltransferase family 4 protein [bacterium]
MNILIDIKFLYEKDCGIKTFLYNTLEELLKISEEINNSSSNNSSSNNNSNSSNNSSNNNNNSISSNSSSNNNNNSISSNINNAHNNYNNSHIFNDDININNINNVNNIKNMRNTHGINHINIDVIGLSGKITKLTREHLNLENIAKKQKFFNSAKSIIGGNSFLYPSIKKIYRFGKKQINKINYTYNANSNSKSSKNKKSVNNNTDTDADLLYTDTDNYNNDNNNNNNNNSNNNADSACYDIFWTPYQTEIDSNIAKKKFITIYDLYILTNKESSVKEHSAAFKNYMDKYLAVFDGVTTCSEFVKKDVVNFYNYPENKIYIVKSAYDKNIFKKISDKNILQSFKDKHNLNNPFILYIGALHPRKNILNLLKAFKKFKNEYSKSNGGRFKSAPINSSNIINKIELVLISNTSMLDKETLTLLDELKDYVKIFKHIGNKELALFYNTAEVFAFPSLYEGFGIPPLEAFACGTPVITSSTTAIPEVCGDAAYYVDPYSINDIENAIFNVITSEKLKKDLAAKGFKRAENFSWRQSAIDLLNAFANELKI